MLTLTSASSSHSPQPRGDPTVLFLRRRGCRRSLSRTGCFILINNGLWSCWTPLPFLLATMAPSDVNALYLQVRKRLIETGEWEQIRAIMFAKLNESGWCDDVRHKSKEIARNMDPLSFTKLMAEISPKTASTSIPLAVKREVSTVIRQHLEKQFE